MLPVAGFTPLLGQPLLVFAASGADLLNARRVRAGAGLTTAIYVAAMFTTGHDAANREVFHAEPADSPDLVGIAMRGPKKGIERATKGLKLHPNRRKIFVPCPVHYPFRIVLVPIIVHALAINRDRYTAHRPQSYWFQLEEKKMHLSLRTTRGNVGSCALAAALLVGSGIRAGQDPEPGLPPRARSSA